MGNQVSPDSTLICCISEDLPAVQETSKYLREEPSSSPQKKESAVTFAFGDKERFTLHIAALLPRVRGCLTAEVAAQNLFSQLPERTRQVNICI